MLRSIAVSGVRCLRQGVSLNKAAVVRCYSHKAESEAEIDARYEAYFNRSDIDGWEIRKAMNDIQGMDMVPNPKIVTAALKACRRVNDYALTVRFLEAIKEKCGDQAGTLYPYIIKEIQPTLSELGISTPEEMGYDKPELYLQSPHEIH